MSKPILPTSDGHHDRADARMLATAIKKRWPIPESLRQRGIDAVKELIDSDDERAKGNGLRVLVAMEAQNQADEHAEDKNKRLDEGKPTEGITFIVQQAEKPPGD